MKHIILPCLILLSGCASIGTDSTENTCRVTGGMLEGDFVRDATEAEDKACVLYEYKTEHCKVRIASTGCGED